MAVEDIPIRNCVNRLEKYTSRMNWPADLGYFSLDTSNILVSKGYLYTHGLFRKLCFVDLGIRLSDRSFFFPKHTPQY